MIESNILAEAAKYDTRTSFQRGARAAYRRANILGVMDRVHAIIPHCHESWSADRLQAEASQYRTRVEFRKLAPNAFAAATRLGVLNRVCGHMPSRHWWSRDELETEALQYATRSDFQRQNSRAYQSARNMGIVDEICSHMLPARYRLSHQKHVYVIRRRGSRDVYIGLTSCLQRRLLQHKNNKKSSAYALMRGGHSVFSYPSPILVKSAGRVEREAIARFASLGWNVVNRARGGAVGSSSERWNQTRAQKVIASHISLRDFRQKNPTLYAILHQKGWQHLLDGLTRQKRISWNLNDALAEASKYGRMKDFQDSAPGAYGFLQKRGHLTQAVQALDEQMRAKYGKRKAA